MQDSVTTFKVIPKMVFAEPPATYVLSDEQRQYYEDNGFLVIKELFDFVSLYSYKQRFLHICKGIVDKGMTLVVKERSLLGKKQNPEDYVNKIQEIIYDDVLFEYTQNPRLQHILRQLIGDDITGIHSMLINKPPGTGRHPPHQDLYYFPYRPADKIIASWTAIDHVTLDNGCLYVIPGSHKKKEIFAHGAVTDANKLYHGILDAENLAPVDQRVHLEMSPGDTVLFHPYLVHGSGPNISQNYRKAITFHFANSNCEVIDVAGTVQEEAARELEEEAKRKGYNLTFAELWQLKSREVTTKSKL